MLSSWSSSAEAERSICGCDADSGGEECQVSQGDIDDDDHDDQDGYGDDDHDDDINDDVHNGC